MREPPSPSKIKFHYIKSNFFRTVRSDGVIGGLNPHADIVMNFYSERQPIPTEVVHEIKPDTMMLGSEVGRKMREGIVREVEISISMNEVIATALRDWLSDRIKETHEAREKYALLRASGTNKDSETH